METKNYPNSKYIGDNIVSLPLSAKLSTKQVKYIIRTVRNVFSNNMIIATPISHLFKDKNKAEK